MATDPVLSPQAGHLATHSRSGVPVPDATDWVATATIPIGVTCLVGGVIKGQQMDDVADILYPIADCEKAPYRFKSITGTGTTATGVVLLFE